MANDTVEAANPHIISASEHAAAAGMSFDESVRKGREQELRDEYAGRAMVRLMGGGDSFDEVIQGAWDYADALIAERAKRIACSE